MIDLIQKLIGRLQFDGLKSACKDLNLNTLDKYENFDDNINDEEFLKVIHHLLFEVHVLDGFLICPESDRRFTVKDGIPNMLLHEDEV